ncbi:MAG TPA: glycoside hydrolase family 88 protein [Bacteroidales bacterium]|nr:glycoside hydrolase family 88 protein [Bacteroidales bacterium]
MKPSQQLLITWIAAFLLAACSHDAAKLQKTIISSLDVAVQQYKMMADSLENKPGLLPRSWQSNGKLITCKPDWWVSGFFPGSLWYLYEYSGDDELKKMAEEFTKRVEDQQHNTSTHDVGFMIYCSFGNGYRITQNEHYKNVILTASKSLSTRFHPVAGCIRSWDWGEWQYPVIIDNMMNLELLFFASQNGYENMLDIAISHANTTLENHFRPDGSCFHLLSYDTITGEVLRRQTRQGYSDESSWARGQAWALHGYTMSYRETGDPAYLDQAEKIADFIIDHPRLPEDKVPYWDFDDPEIPDTYRDASAAAIICSALIELSQFSEKTQGDKYLKVAETLIQSLSSPEYRAEPGTNGNFLLKHCVGSKPENSEVDVPLTYADYYCLEAMMRYKRLMGF